MAISVNTIPSVNVPFTDARGRINPIWHEFLRAFVAASVDGTIGEASAATSVTAGAGLTGGGVGAVTLAVGAGSGIAVNADDVGVNMSNQTYAPAALADEVLISDISDNNTIKKTKVSDITSLVVVEEFTVDSPFGIDNVAAGSGAGDALVSGANQNTFYGKDAGLAVTTSDDNTCIGWSAGKAMTTGTGQNTFIGKGAGVAVTTGTALTAIGTDALAGITASGAAGATAVGFGALSTLTSGAAVTGVGWFAGASWTSHSNNTAVGYSAAITNTGTGNVAIGDSAMINGTASRANNVVIGSGAGNFGTGNTSVVVGGSTCGRQHGTDSVYVGYTAGANSTGASNTGIGVNAMGDGTGGASTKNVAIGGLTMNSGATGAVVLTSASGNTIVGYRAGVSAADCADAIALGQDAVATKATGSGSGDFGPGISIGSAAKPVGWRGDGTIIPATNGCAGFWKAKVNGTQYYIPLLTDASSTLIGRTTAGITASTTQTQGNGALTAEINEISVCANANDTVTLPAAVAGLSALVINNGAQTLQVFPASGDNLGAGADTATTIATTSRKLFVAFDSTNWEPVI